MQKITIDHEKCTGCGLCVKDCVAGFLKLQDGKSVPLDSGCIGCGHCYAICPAEAITLEGMEADCGEFVQMQEFDSHRLLQAMKSRRSIRAFLPREVEPEKLQMILEAGRYCPTGTNAQGVSYTILGSRQDEIEKLCVEFFRKGVGFAGKVSTAARNMNIDDHYFFKGAPLVIVVSAKSRVDAALASSYMELMAESLGLGVLYSGFFVAASALLGKVHRLLELPAGQKVVTCLVIGYPAVKYRRIPGRKPLNFKTL